MDYTAREKEIAARQKEAHLAARREDACEHEWGNCDKAAPVYFGKPSETPHRCKGVRRHLSKLHVCETCGSVGRRDTVTPYTKAGRQLRELILYQAKQAEAATRTVDHTHPQHQHPEEREA